MSASSPVAIPTRHPEMTDGAGLRPRNTTALLAGSSGILLISLALVFNEYLIGLFDRKPPLRATVVSGVRFAQCCYFAAGGLMVAMSVVLARVRNLRKISEHPFAAKALLASLAICLPAYVLELALQPLVPKVKRTTIFMEDDRLGWRLRPNARDLWGHSLIEVNAKGLRGPEREYQKPPGTERILFLGDSVTFGCFIDEYEKTFVSIVEQTLSRTTPVQTINAGVGGYSPWQEFEYLSSEGERYAPDLVVVSFVLNDVTEKFGLLRFGGEGKGSQLSVTRYSGLRGLLDKSSVLYFAKTLGARVRFGDDVEAGARKKQALDVRLMLEEPDREDVQRAWKETVKNLGKLFTFCADRDMRVLLIVFPFTMQFEDTTGTSPQIILTEYAESHGIPILDLLPLLSDRMRQERARPEDYFLDQDHLTSRGHRVVSEIIVETIRDRRLLESS